MTAKMPAGNRVYATASPPVEAEEVTFSAADTDVALTQRLPPILSDAAATNLSPFHHKIVGIYHLSPGRASPFGSTRIGSPAVRPNRPPIVRRFAPIVRGNPSGHSTDNRPITQQDRPIIYRRFGGNYRSGHNTRPFTDDGRPAAKGLSPEVPAEVGRGRGHSARGLPFYQ